MTRRVSVIEINQRASFKFKIPAVHSRVDPLLLYL